ncbi:MULTISPECIES: hypothetical protein [Hyphomonas]|uniref:Uncharacterized protein n=3 Tax=Hyphomonas TaxID=85 RepID=A0A062TR39_9PROT|nr:MULTISPECIES: hypothetical protein [Hyphomonas]KCZ50266.1 hypothetical protein HY2_14710 [Hyphomonas pacifica]KCZ56291.1 hypothetical protein HY29_09580 [Hyphomonas beringensis]RAN32525.1 hypothetical protein HY3_15165 [Hyphomonas pacifica]RAN36806.1 hypothetical protein HY11_11220 [Hyphomonas pacifica]
MLQGFAATSTHLGLICCAMAIGASWVAAIASPNCSYDKLDGSRADRHVRELLHMTSTPIAGMMLASGALFLLSSSWAAGVTALLAAFGFFSNRWMLAPKTGKNPKGVRTSRKGQRAVSVSLSLMFTLIAIIAAILAMVGI